jgi:hypothetical protein
MSRTYRNHPFQHWRHPLEELVDGWEPGNDFSYCYGGYIRSWKKIDPKSQQGRKLLAMSKRDKPWTFKEPGPSWFRNLFEERPLRRTSKRELQRYMDDDEYEPIIDAKQRKRVYWT